MIEAQIQIIGMSLIPLIPADLLIDVTVGIFDVRMERATKAKRKINPADIYSIPGSSESAYLNSTKPAKSSKQAADARPSLRTQLQNAKLA